MNHDPLDGWIPFYLKRGEVHWGYMGQERFVEPFFVDTVRKLGFRPFNQLLRRRTSLDVLLERAGSDPGLPLRGLVFHMGRCGSTLVAQSLAALDDSVVLSEPLPFDTLLQWIVAAPGLAPEHCAALLRALLSALGQARRPGDQRLFVKADCWHIHHIEKVLSAFPGVPWVFLYRDPVEVLVSYAQAPGLIVIPGALMGHGLYVPDTPSMLPLEYASRILGQLLSDAAEAIEAFPGGMLVNYRELPAALETRLNPHFALGLDAQGAEAIRATSLRYSKNPLQAFQPDTAEKQAAANDEIKRMAELWLAEPYATLERLRQASIRPA